MIRRILAALFGTAPRPGRGVTFIATDAPRPTSRTDEDDGPAPLVVADRPRPGPRDLARALLHRHEHPSEVRTTRARDIPSSWPTCHSQVLS